MIPLLTMNINRHSSLPDNQKVKKACHNSVVTTYQLMMKAFLPLKHLTADKQNDGDSPSSNVSAPIPRRAKFASTQDDEDSLDSDDDAKSVASVSSSKSSASRRKSIDSQKDSEKVKEATLPLSHVCILGVLQRMMLTCPDRAPIRAIVSQSVVDLLSTISDIQHAAQLDNSSAPNDASTTATNILQHFVEFLTKLSKSNKVAYRAFSLEVICSLLMMSWFWMEPSKSSEHQSVATSESLLFALLHRCEDASPSVRMRAISAFQDFVDRYDEDSSPAMIQAMYDLLMGMHDSGKSLLDVLRVLTNDEKTLVRGKALHVYSILLTKTWYKFSHASQMQLEGNQDNSSTSQKKLEEIDMHIGEDDLHLFANACRDESLSVRKHALQALGLILQHRPYNESVQLHWIQAALPLALDPETTVVQKLVSQVQDLILSNIFQWKRTYFPSTKSQKRDAEEMKAIAEQFPGLSLGWKLLYQIHALGLLQLFKTCMAFMFKQGYITFNNRTMEQVATSFYQIIDACKSACTILYCFPHLSNKDESTESSNYNPLDSLTENEKELITHAAWIFLECIVSQSHIRITSSGADSGKGMNNNKIEDYLQLVGSVTFVVDCYKHKHYRKIPSSSQSPTSGSPSNISTRRASMGDVQQLDEEDLRILKVLEKLTMNLPNEDVLFMIEEIDSWLQTLVMPSEIASAAIQLRCQLSRANAMINASNASCSSAAQMEADFHKDLQKWTSLLAVKIYNVIYGFIFQELPVGHDELLAAAMAAFKTTSPQSYPAALQSFLKDVHKEKKCVEVIKSSLFLLGELLMLGFKMEEPEIKRLKRSAHFSVNGKSGKANLVDLIATPENNGFRLILPDSMIDLVKMLMGTTLPALIAEINPRPCPVQLRAVSFITLGKLCLRDHQLARENINIFLREINADYQGVVDNEPDNEQEERQNSEISHLTELSSGVSKNNQGTFAARHSSVRSNALLVLGDLCIRHTHLVDRHIDSLACCLQDVDHNVRKNALLLLTQLLVQDFVKWKGLLLYRFLMLINDEDPEIASFSQDILDRTLALKYPGLLHNHISEAFMIFNKCTEHPIYTAVAWASANGQEPDGLQGVVQDMEISDGEKQKDIVFDPHTKAFHAGPNLSRQMRFVIYDFMAKDLSDEMKIQVTAKLVNDILGSAVDNCKRLLPDRSKGTNLQGGSTSASKRKSVNGPSNELTPFETAIEDVFVFLRSPSLKVCNILNY